MELIHLPLKYADENHLLKIMMPACWYYDRRKQDFTMRKICCPLRCLELTFWDGSHMGPKHMIEISERKEYLWVFHYKNNKRAEMIITNETPN